MSYQLYWEKPYETEFTSVIMGIADNGVILEKTLFYPMGGGQVPDKGILEINGIKYNVEDVQKENDFIIHKLKDFDKNKIHISDKVHGIIDWEYRNGNMRAHTSQHIISAYLEKNFNAKTIDAQILSDSVTITLDKDITLDELNSAIEESMRITTIDGRQVKSEVLTQEELKLKCKDENFRGTPSDEVQVRLLEITDWDLMCCGGTHVSKTSEIGPYHIVRFNRNREIKYNVGKKAVRKISESNIKVLKVSNLLDQSTNKFDVSVELRLKKMQELEDFNSEVTIKLFTLLKNKSTFIKNDVKYFVLELPIDKKLITSQFKHFPEESNLIINLGQNKIIIYSNSKKLNAKQLMSNLIKKFGGKGGGNPKISQGMIEQEFSKLIEFLK